jgi:hypothetical protein
MILVLCNPIIQVIWLQHGFKLLAFGLMKAKKVDPFSRQPFLIWYSRRDFYSPPANELSS